MEELYYVYILTSRKNGPLYIGVTNDLSRRVWEHRQGRASAFTRRYQIRQLVWCEGFADIRDAIETEKRLKKWRRAWKVQLIERENPDWSDMYMELA